jgi:hypothetical protein
VDLLTCIPDFRVGLIEYATMGTSLFLRWVARGTSPDGRFEAVWRGPPDRAHGFVVENLILSDHPIFAAIAKHADDLRGA